MVPISLPDLPKPSRTPGKSQKPQFLEPELLYINQRQFLLISLLIPLKGPIRGGGIFSSVYRIQGPFLGGLAPGRWQLGTRFFVLFILARWFNRNFQEILGSCQKLQEIRRKFWDIPRMFQDFGRKFYEFLRNFKECPRKFYEFLRQFKEIL